MPTIQFKHKNHWQNLRSLVSILRTIDSIGEGSEVIISAKSFATPFQIVPVLSMINAKGLTFRVEPHSASLLSYLNTIGFPAGIHAMSVSKRVSKNYLPVAKISSSQLDSMNRETVYKHIEEQYRELIFSCFPNVKDKLSNAVAFFLAELIENAKDHSNARDFYIFAQY